ncbi:MAG: hypothetical protein ACKN9D_04780, partial [Actinomycetales bacterium]
IDELAKLYDKRSEAGMPGEDFWSSSQEGSAVNAWVQYFSNGSQHYGYKNLAYRVRPVRAF